MNYYVVIPNTDTITNNMVEESVNQIGTIRVLSNGDSILKFTNSNPNSVISYEKKTLAQIESYVLANHIDDEL